ncbi:MFS transporter [Lysinimonas soli]|uniref:MFS transporter n=1 Tax=Lysinimonas soli TaxID=1074233 RepID=A0ABW0NQR3_9MICO
MSEPTSAPELPAPTDRRRRLVDITPLRRSPAFARLWIGATVSGVGAQLTLVAVGLQIYDITRSTLAVSLVGGISLVPMVIAGLWGGVLADAFDRRLVLIISAITGWLSTLGLITLAWIELADGGHVPVWPFYAFTTINAVAATITQATRSSVYPRILPAGLLAPASALNGIAFGIQLTLGPAVAGVLVATTGFAWTYTVDALLFTAGFLGILSLPKLAPLGETSGAGWRSLRDGLAFLVRAPNIRAGFLIDLLAMGLGRPFVILPAVGALVIGGGPVTVGILTACAATGTFLTSLFSGPVRHVRRYGLAIGGSVMLYGGFVALFGLVVGAMQTGWFGRVGADIAHVNVVALVIAGVALAGTGASDEVSAIFRTTMMLTAAPDGMRGRLQGIFTVVVTGGPRIGDLYMGTLATLVALWFPPALGGLLIVAAVGVILRVQRGFREYDAADPSP